MTRKTKLEIVFLVGVWLVGGLAWGAYRYRLHLESWWWHRQHGEVVAVADYIVPAPGNWYVEDVSGVNQVLILLDSQNGASGTGLKFPAVISLSTRYGAMTAQRLDAWTSSEASKFKKSGVEPAFRKFNLSGENLSCVGTAMSNPTNPPGVDQGDPDNWSCRSSGGLGLTITTTGADLPQVWEIVSHIHKKR